MATNNILTFCPTDTGTNLLSQPDYAAANDRDEGNQPGIASSKLNNKALRQCAFIASQVAQYISDKTGEDVLDDNDTAALLAIMVSAFDRNVIQAVTGTDTVDEFTDIVEIGNTTSYTVTLPAANSVTGKKFCLVKTGASGTNTISPSINGLTMTLTDQYQFINVYSNGTDYKVCG